MQINRRQKPAVSWTVCSWARPLPFPQSFSSTFLWRVEQTRGHGPASKLVPGLSGDRCTPPWKPARQSPVLNRNTSREDWQKGRLPEKEAIAALSGEAAFSLGADVAWKLDLAGRIYGCLVVQGL